MLRQPGTAAADIYRALNGLAPGRQSARGVEWATVPTPRKNTGRGAPARKRAAPRRRGRRPARRPSFQLQQRHYDLMALALFAAGVYMGFVVYGGWDGGRVGDWLATGLGHLVGQARAGVPVALAGGGALLLLRPQIPSPPPLRLGASLLFAAATLGFAAAGPSRGDWSHASRHGGAVGQAELWVIAKLLGTTGAGIVAVFLGIAGLLLLSRGSLAAAIRGGVAATVRGIRRRRAIAAARSADRVARRPPPLTPPEPADRELVIRATHVEAPAIDPEPYEPPQFHDFASEFTDQDPIEDIDPEPDDDAAIPAPEAPIDELLTPRGRFRASVTDDPAFHWRLPKRGVLTRSSAAQVRPDTAGQERVAAELMQALGHFGIEAKVIGMTTGPHITRYELRLAPGIKVSKVANLKDDLAYALAATDVRILAPIPGKQAVGVEVPNAMRRIVRLGDVYQDPPADWSPLTVWLGKDVSGRAIGADLAKMPHLLVAGPNGAGKSGAVNAMLASILLRATPHDVRLVLIDPKQVELNHYESIPHLLTPVITNPRMAANALANLVREMEQRYGMMSIARTRKLVELNAHRSERGEAPLPYILCVIDELADLMMVAPADVETAIIRLAQKARAVGIHLVLATQSPRVDVITGLIKANVPSRIAFAVSSQTDSRVILDQNGAESLLGAGDMLFAPMGSSSPQRIQGAYIDEPQIAALTEFWRRQGEPVFRAELLDEIEPEAPAAGEEDGFDPDEDPLLEDAIELVVEMGTASTSMLQRKMRLGYTRAGRLMDMLERRGVISGYEGSKPRQVLVSEADLPTVIAALSARAHASESVPPDGGE
jgi:DNA segregation ATPase FtsK/SpoIIIE, S-DNA-T family